MNLDDIHTWTLLVVDDEPDNVEVVSETLEFRGASVRTASNGANALTMLKTFRPDIILLDLSMPQLDGWNTLKRIRAESDYEAIRVVALTAHAMSGDKERVLAAGFDGYLSKPVNVFTLVSDIRNSLVTNCPRAAVEPTAKEDIASDAAI